MANNQTLLAYRQKRTPIKAQITRQSNVILDITEIDDSSHPTLLRHNEKLDSLAQRYEEIQSGIDELEYTEGEQTYRIEVEDVISATRAHSDRLISTYLKAKAQREAEARETQARQETRAKLFSLDGIYAQFFSYSQIISEFFIETQASYFEAISLRVTFKEVFENYNSSFLQLPIDIVTPDLQRQRKEIEVEFHKVIGFLDSLIASNKEKYQPETAASGRRLSLDSVPSVSVPKLPEIRLPSFSGSPSAWIEFKETFTSLILNNAHISNMDRFQYLRSCLSNEVMLVIQNIPVSAATFDVAWKTLSDRFDNDRLIANTHIQSLFTPPLVTQDADSLQRFLDHFVSSIHALQALNTDVSLVDLIVSKLMLDKLQPSLIKEWETSVKPDRLPTLKELFAFLEARVRVRQMTAISLQSQVKPAPLNTTNGKSNTKLNSKPNVSHSANAHNSNSHQSNTTKFNARPSYPCICCNRADSHSLLYCETFRKMSVTQREQFVKTHKLCRICLWSSGHAFNCNTYTCNQCGGRHSSFLHNPNSTATNMVAMLSSPPLQPSCLHPTATVLVNDHTGRPVEAIAILDSGSDCNLITNRLYNKLKLKPCAQRTMLTSVLSAQASSHKVTPISLQSHVTPWYYDTTAIVVPEISSTSLPREVIDVSNWNIPPNLPLANPTFNLPKQIDLLLGVEIFSQIICTGQVTGDGLPVIQNSQLGWYVSGKLPRIVSNSNSALNHNVHTPAPSCGGIVQNGVCQSNVTLTKPHSKAFRRRFRKSSKIVSHYTAFINADRSLSDHLTRFWELEKVSNSAPFIEDSTCEQHFTDNVTRTEDGRYVVKLPFTASPDSIGSTQLQAKKRFLSLEHRLSKDKDLHEQYHDFMEEYKLLGHMEPIDQGSEPFPYVIPHHAVMKPSSTTTKLRVVFDASAKSTKGNSLNDVLSVGPVVQPELFSILLRFRLNPIAFTADIAKMYRQVLVHPEHQRFQQIFWRTSDVDPIRVYNLKTVTYGTAPASYLATRALKQLSIDEGAQCPLASTVINEAIYVDDIVATASNVNQAIQTVAELNTLLPQGGFQPRKWSSNSSEVLNTIPLELQETQDLRSFGDSEDPSIKALGLIWQPSCDVLRIETSVDFTKPFQTCTRRTLLSCIASIFDPLGLIAPIVAYCKIIFQVLWKETLSWDDPIPPLVATKWLKVHEQLKYISQIAIPRFVLTQTVQTIQIHGFCDASEIAYGACLYIRSVNENGSVSIALLCAKSRIAPIKAVTIPRLELLAAHLLSNLTFKVVPTLQLNVSSVYLWSDSNIVLSWLNRSPASLKTFVANRVADIQELTADYCWRHVASKHNPADLISRGSTPLDLVQNQLWWHGPSWLREESSQWPGNNPPKIVEPLPEIKFVSHVRSEVSEFASHLSKFSYLRTLRIVAYILRFLNNAKNPQTKFHGPLNASEIQNALSCCIKTIQYQVYAEEIDALKSGGNISSSSKLSNLCPFLDSDGILRVGGRLERSNLPFDAKHQMLLPSNHAFTKHLIRHTHFQLGHAGPQLLIAHLRERFWVPAIRKIIRSVLGKCHTCFRFKAQPFQQKMADLPAHRINPTPPFTHVSLDYAGPYTIKYGGPKSKITTKAYIAIFVCMATRAIHIELVTSLTSRAFLASLSRFTGRRGIPTSITSDNGTNFVGAQADLQQLSELLSSSEHQAVVQDTTSHLNIAWHFMPPHAPHMGGLHEAAVRSIKHHLRRMLSPSALTYEELSTVLIQVEAILNSRPLIPLHEEVDDCKYLSPGHFLVGKPVCSLPSPDLSGGHTLRSRWNNLHNFVSELWKTWSTDYLQTLQRRAKWTKVATNVAIGTPVLLMEDNLPPLKWALGLIVQTHPGADGLVRVATVKTPSGCYKRPIVKLAPLPLTEED